MFERALDCDENSNNYAQMHTHNILEYQQVPRVSTSQVGKIGVQSCLCSMTTARVRILTLVKTWNYCSSEVMV